MINKSNTERQIVYITYMQNLKKPNTKTERRVRVTRARRRGKRGHVGETVQTFHYKMGKFRGSNIQYGGYS